MIRKTLLSIFLLGIFFTASSIDVYVAKDGSDANDGSFDSPVSTLRAARDLIRNHKAVRPYPAEGFTVHVAGGVYYQEAPFVLNENDNGKPGSQIVYKALNEEKVYLSGGKNLPIDQFQKVKDKGVRKRLSGQAKEQVRCIDLKQLGIYDYGQHRQIGHAISVAPAPLELFFNNEAMQIARYPNTGFVQIEEVVDPGSNPRSGDYSVRGGIIKYKDERHDLWAGQNDIWFQGTFSNGYADDKLHVEWINTKTKELKFSMPHMYALRGGKDFTHYVALNILEELDMPGEWYIDRTTGILYFWPPSDLKSASVKVSILEDPVVCMEGVSHVTFQDFTVENGRGIGIYMERGCNNVVAGCTVRNFGTTGIFMGQGAKQTVPYITHDHYEGVPVSRRVGNYAGHIYSYTTWNRKAGTNHTILSCDVYNTGAGGIVLSGGDKRKLINGNNVVENCKIHDYNRRNKFRWAGVVVDGCGNKVRHNEIYNSDFQAIFTVGPEHVFEYNDIHHVTLHSDDVSVWYTGRDPSDRGQIIRYNYFHHCGHKNRMNMGIYCDDSSGGISVYGNVFYKMMLAHGQLYSNTGWDISMKNNIIIEPSHESVVLNLHYYTWYRGKAPRVFGKGMLFEQRLFKDLNIKEPPYSERYPLLCNYMDVIKEGEEWEGMLSRRNVFANNLIVRPEREKLIRISEGKHGVFENINNYTTNDISCFENFEQQNFMLKPNAKILKEIDGFETIPFNKIGLYIDNYRKSF